MLKKLDFFSFVSDPNRVFQVLEVFSDGCVTIKGVIDPYAPNSVYPRQSPERWGEKYVVVPNPFPKKKHRLTSLFECETLKA